MGTSPHKFEFNLDDFTQGLNQMTDSTKLKKGQYPLLVNGRTRFNEVEPIQKPLEMREGLPASGVIQGNYSVGVYTIVFIGGIAYYRNMSIAGTAFVAVVGWSAMDANVTTIFAEAVSSSSLNYSRSRSASYGVNGSFAAFVNTVGATPACIVCQDGINQPRLILPDGSSRLAYNYDQWTVTDREYVPVGRQMLYSNGVLYVVNGNEIYRSIKGRPLDFMVVVDTAGDKLADQVQGGAGAVSHKVGFAAIQGIYRTPTAEGDIFISTPQSSHFIRPIIDVPNGQHVFGEALYVTFDLFNTGVQNQNSFIEVLGDNVFIDLEGVKSFNAVKQQKIEGNNNPFTAPVFNLFKNIQQLSTTCCAVMDNYAYFAVNTIFGACVLVFDMQMGVFVAIDQYAGVAAIKRFSTVRLPGVRKLLFVTVDNKIYEAFGSTDQEEVKMYIGDFISGDPNVEHQVNYVKLIMSDPEEAGTVYASLYNDGVATQTLQGSIRNPMPAITYPLAFPNGDSTIDRVRNLAFEFREFAKTSWKVGVWITWNFKCKLSQLKILSLPQTSNNAYDQEAQEHQAILEGIPNLVSFSPSSGSIGTLVTITGSNFSNVNGSYIGETAVSIIYVDSDTSMRIQIPSGASTGQIRLQTTNGYGYSNTNLTIV